MHWSFRFVATVTDLRTGRREQVADTAVFGFPVTHESAAVLIRRELRDRGLAVVDLRVTDAR